MASQTLLEQLAVHDECVKDAQTRAQQLARQGAEHEAGVQRLKAERIAAYSAGDEDAAKKLKMQATRAAARSTELDERRQGAELAARRAQDEREVFIRANFPRLIDERRPAAIEAVRRVESAIADLSDAVGGWHAEARQAEALLREAGYGTRGMPDGLPVQRIVRELERVAADGLPAPLPGAQHAPTAPKADDPTEDTAVHAGSTDEEGPLVEVIE